jgi:hypothetical protein
MPQSIRIFAKCKPRTIGEGVWPDLPRWTNHALSHALPGPWSLRDWVGGFWCGVICDACWQKYGKALLTTPGVYFKIEKIPPGEVEIETVTTDELGNETVRKETISLAQALERQVGNEVP